MENDSLVGVFPGSVLNGCFLCFAGEEIFPEEKAQRGV